MQSAELLDRAKACRGLRSDYALAKAAGFTTQQIGNYRSGRSAPGDAAAIKLAELAELDAGAVLAWMAAERAKTAAEREVWQKAASRLATAAAVALALWVAPAALEMSSGAAVASPAVYYVKSVAWLLAAALAILAARLVGAGGTGDRLSG